MATLQAEHPGHAATAPRSAVRHDRPPAILAPWVRSQALNAQRHAAALRPFGREEFGRAAAAPSEGHLQAANQLLIALRRGLLMGNARLQRAAAAAAERPTAEALGRLLALKEESHGWVRAIERVWEFYLELFGQRQSPYAERLLACDRIALNCYSVAFVGIGVARSIPAPPPFSYMRTGFSPATYRRGILLSKIGRMPNPFPLIELPHHRLVNPWTLGAVLHEVSHNLQQDLGLNRLVPTAIAARLRRAGMPESVVNTWVRWNRELFADLSGLLLGGPAIVASLMDVVGRNRRSTLAYSPTAVHPNPYLRPLLSIELLRRMGFPRYADRYERAWRALYPDPRAGGIPPALLRSFPQASRLVVDTVCFQPYATLGDRTLAGAYRFEPKDQALIEEAAQRLAAGTDPGVVPARFLIGAARVALDRRLARPGVIARNFYTHLSRR